MAREAVESRVDNLETRVAMLEQLPERVSAVESQIVQLRTEMHDELSAVRIEMRAGDEETRRYMRVLHEEVINRLALIQEALPLRRTRKSKEP